MQAFVRFASQMGHMPIEVYFGRRRLEFVCRMCVCGVEEPFVPAKAVRTKKNTLTHIGDGLMDAADPLAAGRAAAEASFHGEVRHAFNAGQTSVSDEIEFIETDSEEEYVFHDAEEELYDGMPPELVKDFHEEPVDLVDDEPLGGRT